MTQEHDQNELEEEREIIYIPDEEGNEEEFEVIMKFQPDDSDKKYIMVASVEEDEEDAGMVYTFRYEEDENGEDYKLYPIEEDSDEWDMIEEVFNTFMEEDEA